jgi:DNA-directed RNA polymerase subunit RPC12/RpoP
MVMAKCPSCDHNVRTPLAFDLQGWRQLTCHHCKARLEMKPRPVAIMFPVFIFLSLALSRLGHIFAVVAEVLAVSASVTFVLLLTVQPQVRLRKALPKPETKLGLTGPPK